MDTLRGFWQRLVTWYRGLPIPSAVRKFHSLWGERVPDDARGKAGSATDFPGLLSIVRVCITFGIFLRFFTHRQEYYLNGWRLPVQWVLFTFFLGHTIALELIPAVERHLTLRPGGRRLQVGIDISLISLFYILTYQIDSDFFLFYILPILIVAEYASFRESLIVLSLVVLAFLVTILIAGNMQPVLDPYFASWDAVLVRVFLPRAFSLVVIGCVATFYRRIEMDYWLRVAARAAIRERISTLVRMSEFKDPETVDTVLRMVLAGITAEDGLGFDRALLFLERGRSGTLQGRCGVGSLDRAQGRDMWKEVKLWQFENIVDLNERRVKYPSRRLNQSLVNKTISESVIERIGRDVIGRDPQMLRVTVDQYPDLSTILKEFDLDEFAIVPLYSMRRIIGVIIADNVVTRREITKSDCYDLVLSANLAADAVENAALLQEHVDSQKTQALAASAFAIGHEMRDPLQAVKTSLELLSEEAISEGSAEMIREAQTNVRRIQNILGMYRKYAKTGETYGPLVVDVTDLVRESLSESSITEQILSAQIELVTSLPYESQGPCARLDPDLVKCALKNILQNAIDAVLIGGKRRIEVGMTERKGNVRISVRDYGPGISVKDFPQLKDVFEPFATTKLLTEKSGVGLGLAIARAAVKAHGGNIEVCSGPDGATFTIVLPAWALD